jgi:hypothetical protein
MDGHQSRRTIQSYWSGYCALLAFVVLSPLVLGGAISRPARAVGSGDLLSNVPVVDENTLNNAACGVAAATMVLDYYLPQSGPIHQAIDITSVSQYVKQYYGYNAKTNKIEPEGTTYDQLQTGIEVASTAPELHLGVSLKAAWHTTDSSHWFSVLTSELDAKRPIVLFLANGRTLGWNWDYGHFIVVSGYASDNSIIYHDPWDGKPHSLSKDAFAASWGTTWNGNPAWQYMQVMSTMPPTLTQPPTPSPINTAIPTPTATPTPTFLLEVNPSSIDASNQNVCPNRKCEMTLSSPNSNTLNIDWKATITIRAGAGTGTIGSVSPSRGTLVPSQVITVSFIISSYICGDITGSNITFTGGASPVVVQLAGSFGPC